MSEHETASSSSEMEETETSFLKEESSQGNTPQIVEQNLPPPPPAKRPVGRPRKHPLPPNYIPPPKVDRSRSLFHQELENQGISAKDIQKYLLKKKVKKYVQQYVQKYQPPPNHYRNTYKREEEEEEELDVESVDETSEEEEIAKPQIAINDSNRQPEHSNNVKLNQILGSQRRNSSQPRYAYRY